MRSVLDPGPACGPVVAQDVGEHRCRAYVEAEEREGAGVGCSRSAGSGPLGERRPDPRWHRQREHSTDGTAGDWHRIQARPEEGGFGGFEGSRSWKWRHREQGPAHGDRDHHGEEGKNITDVLRLSCTATHTHLQVIHVEAKKEMRRRIVRELQIMYDCNSEYIVNFYGAFLSDNNDVIMCMEYMDVG